MTTKDMKNGFVKGNDKETALALQRLCREQLKHRILADILQDITVCRIEGWDYKEYLYELLNLIKGFLKTEA